MGATTAGTNLPSSAGMDAGAVPGRRWSSGLALFAVVGLFAAAAAAWLGYRSQVEPEAPSQPVAARSPAAERPAGETPPGGTRNQPLTEATLPRVASGAVKSTPNSLSWPLWEFRLRQPIPPREPSLTPPTWRLVGSALTGGKWSIIVLRQGSATPEYLSVGDELPGGYRIEAINDEDVTLSQGKRLMVLSYIGSR